MKKNAIGWFGFAFAATAIFAPARAELVRNPTAVGANFDVGEIVRGKVDNLEFPAVTANDQVITRTGVYVTESGTYNGRLSVHLTVGGLFWYGLPESPSFSTRLLQFGPGVGQAQAQYVFGKDVKDPAATLQFGLFPVKYNPDAKDLGEYLFRSSSYPTVIFTGGWSYLDAASYMAQGAKLNVPMLHGELSHDFVLFQERDIEPTGDLDLGYLVTYKPTSYVEVGGGALWTHAIPIKDEKDFNAGWAYNSKSGIPVGLPDTVTGGDTAYYTFHSVKIMARAALDVGSLLGMDAISRGDFKIYGEWAWLGVKDYPYYYDKPFERMPIMVGVNLPTFKLLDKLSFEMEYHKSRFQDNVLNPMNGKSPIPVVAGPAASLDSAEYTRDDIKWALYLRRHIIEGMSVVGMAACDHFRPFDAPHAVPSSTPVTDVINQWYFVLRLEIGI